MLVVDDDARSATVLARLLRDDGWDAEIATDGRDAIGRLAAGERPDVLVTDLRMPHADGAAIAQFARSRDRQLPVVVVTAYPELSGDLACALEPPPTVLTKPVDYAALVDVLAHAHEAPGRH